MDRLTTTFTCLESLLDQTMAEEKDTVATHEVLRRFTAKAFKFPDDWQSEGAATTYCRVRSLGPIFRHAGTLSAKQREVAKKLLDEAWSKLEPVKGHDGIYEQERVGASAYPPNAYLSYWALASLDRSPKEIDNSNLKEKRDVLELWFEKSLGRQIALHSVKSRRSDPQQLAWSICGYLMARPEALPDRPGFGVDLVNAGLKAFFEQQDANGVWPRGEALFHYPEAGNAYCYVFETLAELLSLAMQANALGDNLRRDLLQYCPNLIRSYEYAVETARPLDAEGNRLGWCSGHHPNRPAPESWATASVFRFFEGLRQLLGIWTRERAAKILGVRQPAGDLSTFVERGDTWNAKHGSVGLQLASLFVHPIEAFKQYSIDPDEAVLTKLHSRSAMLFGPPGTGKTTLIEALAGALGWSFIEITPAQFLDRGVDLVSARADEIFRQLMELDHHVVLLDEIDELIRQRDDRADSMERFFTTTMLPRLARLWAQKKVLFFVNTNAIDVVDSAVRRSQRFDALIFTLPPSFASKAKALRTSKVDVEVTEEDVVGALTPGKHGTVEGLAWIGLLRYEQLQRFASSLVTGADGKLDKGTAALGILEQFGQELMESDWLDPSGDVGQMDTEKVIARYSTLANFQRRDHGRLRVVKPVDAKVRRSGRLPEGIVDLKNGYWSVETPVHDLSAWLKDQGYAVSASGEVSRL